MHLDTCAERVRLSAFVGARLFPLLVVLLQFSFALCPVDEAPSYEESVEGSGEGDGLGLSQEGLTSGALSW